jgi:uncharacterized protein YifN (PemK superfamily)
MPIQFPVGPGTILRCDYSRGGFQVPEMIKARPAIVISPRLPHRDGLCTVVPLSSTPPPVAVDYVVELRLAQPLPEPYAEPVMWAKCDMLATVGFGRLDLFRTGRDQYGKRRYLHPKLPAEDFARICNGIRRALGFPLT